MNQKSATSLHYERRLKSGYNSSYATATNTNEVKYSQAPMSLRDQYEEQENA